MTVSTPHDSEAVQRQATVERWRKRSRRVRFWRKVLPMTILAIVLCIAGWVLARGLMPQPILAPLELSAIRMKGPKFFGRDKNDRAFLLAALEAVRDAKQEGRVNLTNPTFNLGGGSVRANQGIYVDGAQDLLLRGDVVVVDADGGRMETQEALIDLRTGVVTNRQTPGSKGVQIESSMGKITAQDYTIAKDGAVTFRGRVRGTINTK